MADLTLSCPNCSHPFGAYTLNKDCDTMTKLNAWLKSQASTTRFWCASCSNGYDIVDDGTPADEGGSVTLSPVS